MDSWRFDLSRLARDERGVALPMSLWVLITMSALAIAVLSVSLQEPQISTNLAATVQARYAAEAGIEFGFNTLAASTNWSALLAGATSCTAGAAIASNAALPGLTTAFGAFAVTVRNDCAAGDATITGVAVDGGGATSDTNSRVIVEATGVFGSTRRTLSVVVARATLPTINAALGFPGQEANISVSGSAFSISGVDQNIDGSPGTAAPVYGISVASDYPNPPTPGAPGAPGSNEAQIEDRLNSTQEGRVTGKNQAGAGTATGVNTIAADAALTPSTISEFVNAAKAVADIKLDSTPSAPLSFNDIGSTCSTDVNDTACWGTQATPKIVYIRGTPPDPSSAFQALNVNGNSTGYGILIVEDGDFLMRGNFTWYGPIFVTGNYVGAGLMGGGGAQSIHGALIVNETATNESTGYNEALIAGSGTIQYSRQAIDLLANSRRLLRAYSWREH